MEILPQSPYLSAWLHITSMSHSQAELEQYAEQLTQMSQMQFMQSLMSNFSDSCFKKCVATPKYQLDGSQTSCIGNCTDTLIESMSLVEKVLSKRMEAAASANNFGDA